MLFSLYRKPSFQLDSVAVSLKKQTFGYSAERDVHLKQFFEYRQNRQRSQRSFIDSTQRLPEVTQKRVNHNSVTHTQQVDKLLDKQQFLQFLESIKGQVEAAQKTILDEIKEKKQKTESGQQTDKSYLSYIRTHQSKLPGQEKGVYRTRIRSLADDQSKQNLSPQSKCDLKNQTAVSVKYNTTAKKSDNQFKKATHRNQAPIPEEFKLELQKYSQINNKTSNKVAISSPNARIPKLIENEPKSGKKLATLQKSQSIKDSQVEGKQLISDHSQKTHQIISDDDQSNPNDSTSKQFKQQSIKAKTPQNLIKVQTASETNLEQQNHQELPSSNSKQQSRNNDSRGIQNKSQKSFSQAKSRQQTEEQQQKIVSALGEAHVGQDEESKLNWQNKSQNQTNNHQGEELKTVLNVQVDQNQEIKPKEQLNPSQGTDKQYLDDFDQVDKASVKTHQIYKTQKSEDIKQSATQRNDKLSGQKESQIKKPQDEPKIDIQKFLEDETIQKSNALQVDKPELEDGKLNEQVQVIK